MSRLALTIALGTLLALGACGTTNTTDFIRVTRALHQEGCKVGAHVNAQAGVVNAGSGVMFNADIDCSATPPSTPPPASNSATNSIG